MSQATSTAQLKLIDVRAPLWRALLIIPVALACAGAFFAARWYIGNTLAEFTPGVEQGGLETTRRALGYAPGDPIAYWSAANLELRSPDPARMPEAVRLYEEAVRLSPNDYRLWLSLGQGRERAGDAAGAEKALRRAIELSPNYARPRWYLGNMLLRAGRTDEAFVEMRRAADGYPLVLRPHVFEAAWNVFNEDVKEIERVVGAEADTRAQLAAFLAARGRAGDAVRLWMSLSAPEKHQQREKGEELMRALFGKRQFRAAQELARDLNLESAETVGQFANGGFETNIAAPNVSLFGWQVAPVAQVEVRIDAGQHRSGNRSLLIIFKGFASTNYHNIMQVVVVEPNTRYRFEGYVRTQDLKSGGTPLLEVADTGDGKILGTSAPFPIGRNEWQPVTFEFSTPEKTEGVYFRTNRAFCGEVCPIFGSIWYDDFNLQRLGASAGQDNSGAGRDRNDKAAAATAR
ncbi:MAG: tetratricopeptide repeat protein [Pyrinomonadaceae bacterium]|nr:tetratricopeptide repeat protein [Pyrinomonadaceae bacterium]